jgi:Leucine-rich repeat (LRR) protein
MKYAFGIFVIVLIVGGIFLGFNLGKKNTKSNTSGSGNASTTSDSGSTTTTKSSTNAKVLDLSNKGLTNVTSDVYGQTGTTDLILSNNNIRTLPSEMGKMTSVVIFKIDHNILDGSLIGEIRQMSKLRQLDVSYNKMTGMPAEIGQLDNLETLNYSYNNISGLPNELANLKNNLKEFNLTGNPLSQAQINKLKTSLPNTNIIF